MAELSQEQGTSTSCQESLLETPREGSKTTAALDAVPDLPLPSALMTSPTPGPQWGRVCLGSQGGGCPAYALEATCSLEERGPQEGGTQTACDLASVQGAAQPHKSVC